VRPFLRTGGGLTLQFREVIRRTHWKIRTLQSASLIPKALHKSEQGLRTFSILNYAQPEMEKQRFPLV
jgi:hypothetical protein